MKKTAKKFDLNETITNKFIKALEQGTAPWTKPWITSYGSDYCSTKHSHINFTTGTAYRGINTMILDLECHLQDFSTGQWASFKQISAKGGKILKGSKSTQVIFWSVTILEKNPDGTLGKKIITKTPEQKREAEKLVRQGKAVKIFKDHYYNVFNIEQTDLFDETKVVKSEPINAGDLICGDQESEDLIDDYIERESIRLNLQGKQSRCFYTPSQDYIEIVPQADFKSTGEYYHTIFHEMAHSTGHEDRLNRLESAGFGSDPYAREELVAEITASFLSNRVGLLNTSLFANSQAYCNSWASQLKKDKTLIFKASQEAQKAFDLIINA